MSQDKLKTAIGALRAELQRAKLADPQEHERLRKLVDEVERGGNSEALLRRIGDSVRRLEVEHPTLTGILGQVATALSNMGI